MAIYNVNAKGKLFRGAVKVKKAYLGSRKVYSSGNIVTYHVDSGVSYQEEVDDEASCLSPTTFTPSKSGWIFAGWRQDTTASSSVLSSLTMGDNPITLYAVFLQNISLTTIANGSTSSQTKSRVYNNGNAENPTFTVSNPSKSGATFKGWSISASSASVSHATLANGVSLSASSTLYAVFAYANSTIAINSITLSDGGWIRDTTKAITSSQIDFSKYSSASGSLNASITVDFELTTVSIAITAGGASNTVLSVGPKDSKSVTANVSLNFPSTSGSGYINARSYYSAGSATTGYAAVRSAGSNLTLHGRTVVG